MKKLFDALPLLFFFIFYNIYDIFIASAAMIVTSGCSLVMRWWLYSKLETLSLISFAFIFIFGTLTISMHNPDYIKWKGTILYALISIVFLYSHFFMQETLVESMLGKDIHLSKSSWRRLNIIWVIFFVFCSIMNTYSIFYFSQAMWVTFKVFGLGGFVLLFGLWNGVYIYRKLYTNNSILKRNK
ncbi:Probable intracellular septation protein A [Candidatus Erwinia haradaeae]|uniref:Inner membrane-spanning protein YciB n=1 Tax=Candidatus Erwinia haradaeae TaxID=1922217 RepID=A0A451D078_9GAMM|nr:septation protein IspZ [Candidatus Erwinia haradaeae]VFP78832.1 Probable intracellular septation protein A [Candidatus Erwinia haradaeae]